MPPQLPSANVVSATLVQLAAGSGIALGALFLRIFESTGALGGDATAPYRGAFLAMAALMLLSTLDSLSLQRHAGAEVSRGRQPERKAAP
jgi:hypothetical protein